MVAFIDSTRALMSAISGSSVVLLLAKVTIIAAIGRLAVAALPRAAAATRHLVSMTTMVAILLLPVVSLAVPAWSLRVLPGASADVSPSKARAVESVEPVPSADMESAPAAAPQPAPAPRPAAAPSTVSSSTLPWALFGLVLAATIALALIGRLLFGIGEVWTVAQTASDIEDKIILEEFDRARTRLGIKRPVRVLSTDLVGVPVAWGIRRPVLLLPNLAMQWTRERLQVVFLHELAHVRRIDGIGLLLTRVATSLYWFHPIVWMLDRVARRDCERACDDVVIASGERPSDYADHLLSIARTLPDRDPFAALALAISRPSQLEGRLLSILKTDARRVTSSGRTAVVAALVASFFIIPIAALRLTAAPVSKASAVKNAVLNEDAMDLPQESTTYDWPLLQTTSFVDRKDAMNLWNVLAMFESVSKDTERQGLGSRDRLISGLAVRQNARQLGHLADPPTVILALDIYCEVTHGLILSLPKARRKSPPRPCRAPTQHFEGRQIRWRRFAVATGYLLAPLSGRGSCAT